MEKTYFTTEESFPAVLRRSEVVQVEALDISPVENALLEMEQKNKELNSLYMRYSTLAKAAQVVSTNPLSMALNGVVDTPAGGGVASFRTSYLTPDYVTSHPERSDSVNKLRAAVDSQVRVKCRTTESISSRLNEYQVRIIDSCLRLHGQLCPPEMLAFHETLEKFFHKNFQEEIGRLSFDAPTERGIASSLRPPETSSYASSLTDATSIVPSNASAVRAPFAIPPLHLPGPNITPPQSPATSFAGSAMQPTRLQKHMAHLARHGMNAVSSGPGEGVDGGGMHRSDSLSMGSPHGSFVNVTGTAGPSATNSGTSIAGSKSGSFKGRFSRLGSLSFGRRDGNAS